MTFTIFLKEEISKKDFNINESLYELEGFIKCCAKIKKEIILTLENASVARKIYRDIKRVFNISCNVTVRNQKRFRVKQIYILTIKENINIIKERLNLNQIESSIVTDEEKIAFLQGAFLAIGNVSNPQTSGYHLEFICSNEKLGKYIVKLLQDFSFNAKLITRGYKFIVYLKASEQISDLIKMFKANQALYFFEDVRIYRDHKNMVNRLNNCEISNQTKALATGQKQLKQIAFLEENGLIELIDEKTKTVIEARKKYPESSLVELAEIITLEYNYKIGKSGVNHHFIKIDNMIKNYKKNNK